MTSLSGLAAIEEAVQVFEESGTALAREGGQVEQIGQPETIDSKSDQVAHLGRHAVIVEASGPLVVSLAKGSECTRSDGEGSQ